ncbi:MAG: LysR family transcriptional regulator [Gammaproteobacteria bacterium]
MDKLAAMRGFSRIAELGSVSAAARQLGRSKASVSKQLALLEADLGVQLLLRTTRRVRLTEAGFAYLERCRQLLADLDDLENQVRHREAALGGTLRVAGPQTFAELYLAPAVEAFLQAHPALHIELTLTDGFVDLLQDHYDLAIRIGVLEDSSLIARRIAQTAIVCCAAPAYLEQYGTPRDPAALAHHALVIDTNFRQPASWRFRVDGQIETVRVQGRLQVNSAVFVRQLLLAGAGIGLIPAFVVGDALDDGRLQQLPLVCEPRELGVHAVYAQRRHLAQRVRVFVDFLAQWLAAGWGAARVRTATEHGA